MKIITVDSWDDAIWKDAAPLYFEAFGNKGAKPEKVIKNMFAKQIAELHVAYKDSVAVAMAITGTLDNDKVIIIDYLAVAKKERGHGLGKYFVHYLREKAACERFNKIIIEIESDVTPENNSRVRFWQACGFLLTTYVHHYIWVPETYQAMYFPLVLDEKMQTGEELFIFINRFHGLSFRGAGEK
ncbi:GNAT family N-acetyltransferase [Caldibacillus lycopersici]|uniref:GNAT family N-acetyltransferase n=1 Tax=Perspicuibacillus lycopersici TaxID=1325689 RepID=A0AAE3IWV8_9BACI|nr:GNAT family N-acetyltransferase [Perspicuibacillus lycopersici]MCU9614871.1 GNAT family N-acetyltransferase [Perspicuibacillus lycopersici]